MREVGVENGDLEQAGAGWGGETGGIGADACQYSIPVKFCQVIFSLSVSGRNRNSSTYSYVTGAEQ